MSAARTAARIGAAGVGVAALVVAGGGPAAARALPKYGGHTGFHSMQSGTATEAAPHTTDINGNPVNQPKADVVSASAVDDGSTIALSVKVQQWSDPTLDPGWRSAFTGIDWEIDTTVPGADQYDAVFTEGISGPSGVVWDNTGTTSRQACAATPSDSAADSTYTVSFPASCVGSPQFFRWSATMAYDPNAADTTGVSAAGETTPGSATDPVPEGEPGVVAGGTAPATQGYWITAADGEVFNHGTAAFYGSPAALNLNAPIISSTPSFDGKGYYLVGQDGGVFSYGDAAFYGSEGGRRLDAPIVAVVPTATGNGYWLVAADGGVFSFGDATFYGSEGGVHLNAPIVGATRSPGGHGYYLLGADGGVFSFGDAVFHGSTGGLRLNEPVLGISIDPAADGYWLVAADGGIFSFNAPFYGSAGNLHLNAPVVGITPSTTGKGYRLVGADGGLFTYGDAEFDGSEAGSGLGDVFSSTMVAPSA